MLKRLPTLIALLIVALLAWTWYLFAASQFVGSAVFNPNPRGSHVTVGAWHPADWGPYQVRDVTERSRLFVVYGEQKRDADGGGPVSPHTVNLRVEKRTGAVAASIAISLLLAFSIHEILWRAFARIGRAQDSRRGFAVVR